MVTGEVLIAKPSASVKVLIVSGLTFAVGILGLLTSDSLHSAVPIPQWKSILTVILQHSSEILASVGLIGLLLELFVRRELTTEIVQRLRELFRIDRSVAEALSSETRQDIVRTTLSAHLGDSLGPAIFNGLVLGYLKDKNANRSSAYYEVTLREMTSDRTLSTGQGTITFPASQYFELFAEYRFSRTLSLGERKTVVCNFGDDWCKMIKEFNASDFLLRESLPICTNDRERLAELLGSDARQINQLCAVSVKLDHNPMISTLTMIQDTKDKSIVNVLFEVDVTNVPKDKDILHEITIKGLIDKSCRRFPVFIVEPTCSPVVTFTYPLTLAVKKDPIHFLTDAAPFDPQIDNWEGKIRISMRTDNPAESWVFPISGIVFTWDLPTGALPSGSKSRSLMYGDDPVPERG